MEFYSRQQVDEIVSQIGGKVKSLQNQVNALTESNGVLPVKPLSDMKYGVIGPAVVYNLSASITLTANRLYYVPFYVDKPVTITGAEMAVRVASSTSGAVIRTGIVELQHDNPDVSNYRIGSIVADFGTVSADTTGPYAWNPTPLNLGVGWHCTVYGCNGSSVSIDYARQLQLGWQRFRSYGSGTGATHRQSTYLYDNSEGTQITNGLTKQNIALTDAQSTNAFLYQGLLLEYSYQ